MRVGCSAMRTRLPSTRVQVSARAGRRSPFGCERYADRELVRGGEQHRAGGVQLLDASTALVDSQRHYP